MIDFEKIYTEFESETFGHQKKIPLSSPFKLYYGISEEGCLRISFLSAIAPPKLDSTKMLQITQGQEGEEYWTCLDLLDKQAKKVFYVLCSDLLLAISKEESEQTALKALGNRYHTWKSMFQKEYAPMSEESMKGLLGELYFMLHYMIPVYGSESAVSAWSGADRTSKDFSKDLQWFEVKAVSTEVNAVRISSLEQLSSPEVGQLFLVRLEKMSEVYSDGESSVLELFESIQKQLPSDSIKEEFVSKVVAYGFSGGDKVNQQKYKVVSMEWYLVDDKFPRLQRTDINHPEISKLSYELLINTLEPYKVVE